MIIKNFFKVVIPQNEKTVRENVLNILEDKVDDVQ